MAAKPALLVDCADLFAELLRARTFGGMRDGKARYGGSDQGIPFACWVSVPTLDDDLSDSGQGFAEEVLRRARKDLAQ